MVMSAMLRSVGCAPNLSSLRGNDCLGLGPNAAQTRIGFSRIGSRRCGSGGVRASASFPSSSTGGRELYQPFRPPPREAPPRGPGGGGEGGVEEQLELLRERQGLWFAYAPAIPALARAGFTPSEIDEATGLTGHEQNQLVVGAQVRDSLVASGFDERSVAWFDVGGDQLLYELRTLSASERMAAADFVIARGLDARLVRDLARSVRDFPRRKRAEGFASFSAAPGDCLAFALYRQSRETTNETEIEAILTQALGFAVTDKARAKIRGALGQGEEEFAAEEEKLPVEVLVMRVSSEKIPVLLPVADFSAAAVEQAPTLAPYVETPFASGNFNVVKTETAWNSWIAIPTCNPIKDATAPVAVLVPDASVLPKNIGIVATKGNPILVIVDKGDREVGSDAFYVVGPDNGASSITLQLGSRISAEEKVLGKVLLALKPPVASDPNMESDYDY